MVIRRFTHINIVLLIALVLVIAAPAWALQPDTDLSTADASFIGEDAHDVSGFSR